jgi:hypothetical protein
VPTLVTRYSIAHLVAALLLAFAATPNREAIVSWAWRFRGRTGYLRGLLLGDRTDNRGMLVVFCAIGLVNLALFVLLPQVSRSGGQPLQAAADSLIRVCFLTVLLILALATFYQWCVLIASRPGKFVFFIVLGGLVAAPMLLAVRWETEWMWAMSPLMQYGGYLKEPAAPLPYPPIVAVYTPILALAWWSVGRRIGQHVARVEGKLRAMGVVQGSSRQFDSLSAMTPD